MFLFLTSENKYHRNIKWCVFFVFFLQDLKDSVTRIAQFLNKPLDSKVVEEVAERCVFKNMKQNKMSNYSMVPPEFMDQSKSEFLRKGKFQMMDHFLLTVLFPKSTNIITQLVTFSNKRECCCLFHRLFMFFRNHWGLEKPANCCRSGNIWCHLQRKNERCQIQICLGLTVYFMNPLMEHIKPHLATQTSMIYFFFYGIQT